MNRFKRKFSFYILTRFITWLVVFTVALAVCFLAAMYFGVNRMWFPGPLYDLLSFLLRNAILLFILCWIIGFILIFIVFWIKTLGYLENIIKATEAVYRSENELIILPEALKEVESQMNQIKLNIKESQRAAKEAEQRKNDLIVYLAHDLKTPLTSVIGYLTLLRDEDTISEEIRKKYLAISLEKAERLEDLINEFFEITRFNLTATHLNISNINLTRMIEQIAYEFKPLFLEKGLEYDITLDPDIMIKCDANKMSRVFDNIIRNAVNYSFNGTTISISGGREGGKVKLKFRNAGDTIPSDKLNRIFEQFYRLDDSRATRTGGAGLGLAIAKEIITLHGGVITAVSQDETIEFEVVISDVP